LKYRLLFHFKPYSSFFFQWFLSYSCGAFYAVYIASVRIYIEYFDIISLTLQVQMLYSRKRIDKRKMLSSRMYIKH